jgi:cytochrome c oxidase cbb3-type subunit 2
MIRIATTAAALAAAAGLCALCAPVLAQTAKSKSAPDPLARGLQIYVEHCAACHGVKGDGEGPGAYILSQRPRNFTIGVFKFRSTKSGDAPTDQDLFRTITAGLSGETGAMMPSFEALPEADRRLLVRVVKRFAGITRPGVPVNVPAEPAARDLALGAAIYERLKCADCHGVDGRGDGPSSTTLKDDQKRRIWAPNLTRGLYKRGAASTDLYLSFATGLDGSPMPSYADKATPGELWALTHYVRSLGTTAAQLDDKK